MEFILKKQDCLLEVKGNDAAQSQEVTGSRNVKAAWLLWVLFQSLCMFVSCLARSLCEEWFSLHPQCMMKKDGHASPPIPMLEASTNLTLCFNSKCPDWNHMHQMPTVSVKCNQWFQRYAKKAFQCIPGDVSPWEMTRDHWLTYGADTPKETCYGVSIKRCPFCLIVYGCDVWL